MYVFRVKDVDERQIKICIIWRLDYKNYLSRSLCHDSSDSPLPIRLVTRFEIFQQKNPTRCCCAGRISVIFTF